MSEAKSPQLTVTSTDLCLYIKIGGQWQMQAVAPPETTLVLRTLQTQTFQRILVDAQDLQAWDSSLLVFLTKIVKISQMQNIPVEYVHLPEGLQRLINLALTVKARAGSARNKTKDNFLEVLGWKILALQPNLIDFLAFMGDVIFSLRRFLVGQARMRAADFFEALYECGLRSLGIVSISTLLFGLILAFVGAVQLTQFGAQIYVAGLVGIGMLRVMGAVMVGIVMAGRIGAAYAALIGTMQVNEEVDALDTLGISPVDFLVLPRILALVLMVPILTLYADFMGILGGYLVGVGILGLNSMEYLNATLHMVGFRHLLIGLVYATAFGMVIAVAGCYQGLRCGRSAQAVGYATTAAVVHSIVGIIVTTAMITVICNALQV